MSRNTNIGLVDADVKIEHLKLMTYASKVEYSMQCHQNIDSYGYWLNIS